MVELEWSYDKNGKRVNIDGFNDLEKNELKPFYCILCFKENNECIELSPKKGKQRAHHFAHKGEYAHSSESIENLNAKMFLFNRLKNDLAGKQPFFVGINLGNGNLPQKNRIYKYDILKKTAEIKLEKCLRNRKKKDICFYNEDGNAFFAIKVVSKIQGHEKKDKDDISSIEIDHETIQLIKSKAKDEIRFEISMEGAGCSELLGDGRFCRNDSEIRLHCLETQDDSVIILDFEKCPTYIKQEDRRCSFILANGNKCNRVLLETEQNFCENCRRELIKIEEKAALYKLEKERADKLKLKEGKPEKGITIQEPEFITADRKGKPAEIKETMKIKDLNLPAALKEFYTNSGMTDLYPPQADAIRAGLLEDKNIVAAIPTASGKTLLAEFAMVSSILNETKRGKALYIVPLRALASEKYDRFRGFEVIKKNDGRGVTTGIATGDYDASDEWLGKFDIIVATSEKVDSLLRNGSRWMEEITVVIADEVHLIDSPDRGPTLEIVLAKLMRQKPQIIALSATIGNAHEVAKWLDAVPVISEWRPTKLKEGVFFGNAINFADFSQREIKPVHKDNTISLVVDILKEDGQCLVFESSRKNTEGMASRIGTSISSLIPHDTKEKLKALAAEMRETSEVETTRKLAQCIENGSAFHHAGLISDQRKLVEGGFRSGLIKVITATPTLAAGLNLPARRVIIKGYRRYDVNFGMTPIPVLEYKQMAGRAGRPRLDPYGESVLIAKTFDELEDLMKQYVLASAEKIWSKLGSENALRTHILSTIVTGFARDMKELLEFMGATFYSTQQEPWSLKAVIDKIINFLVEKKMIQEKDGMFGATRLGELVSRLYIDPLSASTILEGMEKIEEKDIRYTELTLLHLVSMTPDMRKLYLRSNDYELLSDIVMEHHAEFVQIPPQFKTDYEWFLSEVKTASVMLDWINEKKEDYIVDKFGIGEGDIRALSETTLWLVHSMTELGRYQKRSSAEMSGELEKRVEYGASPELLDLIQIRGIGRVRARRLYNSGIRNMQELRIADHEEIAKIIGPKIAMKVLKQIGISPTIEEKLDEQRRLGDFE